MSETIKFSISTKYMTYHADDKMVIKAKRCSPLFGAFNAMCQRSSIPQDTCFLVRLDEEKNVIEDVCSLGEDYNANKVKDNEVLYLIPTRIIIE